jgi:hypothetical protein
MINPNRKRATEGWPMAQRDRLKGRFSSVELVIGAGPLCLICDAWCCDEPTCGAQFFCVDTGFRAAMLFEAETLIAVGREAAGGTSA